MLTFLQLFTLQLKLIDQLFDFLPSTHQPPQLGDPLRFSLVRSDDDLDSRHTIVRPTQVQTIKQIQKAVLLLLDHRCVTAFFLD